MQKKIINHTLTIVFIIALFLFILTFSIGLPIYFRPFYYLQIKTLNMEAKTGFTFDQIKNAYDEVLNYLTISTPFGTGDLKWSESGYQHFADCKVLFDLNFYVLLASTIVIVTILVLHEKRVIKLINYFKFPPYFYTSIICILFPSIIAILASQDFDKAFEIFHKIFFPGKDNWLFNPNTDEIIKVMPETFFMNCAILIGSSIVLISLVLFIISFFRRKKFIKNND